LCVVVCCGSLQPQVIFQQTANITFSVDGAPQDIFHIGDEGFASIIEGGSDASMAHETTNPAFALCHMLADVTFRSYTLTHTVESHQLIDQVMD
jgi:hypothetical protein